MSVCTGWLHPAAYGLSFRSHGRCRLPYSSRSVNWSRYKGELYPLRCYARKATFLLMECHHQRHHRQFFEWPKQLKLLQWSLYWEDMAVKIREMIMIAAPQRRNNYVFSLFLNVADVTSLGGLFFTLAPAAGKARRPTVDWRKNGTSNCSVYADLSLCRTSNEHFYIEAPSFRQQKTSASEEFCFLLDALLLCVVVNAGLGASFQHQQPVS